MIHLKRKVAAAIILSGAFLYGSTVTLNVAQQAALATMKVPAELQTAVTAASKDLTLASVAVPVNPGDIAAKAQVLATAELALATARAREFEKVQALLTKIPADFTPQSLNVAQRAALAAYPSDLEKAQALLTKIPADFATAPRGM